MFCCQPLNTILFAKKLSMWLIIHDLEPFLRIIALLLTAHMTQDISSHYLTVLRNWDAKINPVIIENTSNYTKHITYIKWEFKKCYHKTNSFIFWYFGTSLFIKPQRRITQMLYLGGYSKEKIGKQVYFNWDTIIILFKGVIIR